MLKKILFFVLIITHTVQSQTSVKGTMNPALEEYTWIVMYQLKGAKQIYITNTTVDKGEFKIDFPEDAQKGMYRLMYDMNNGGFIDFIYNNETIELQFDPTFPSGTAKFLNSEENELYTTYTKESIHLKQKLDSIQLTYFNLKVENEKKETVKSYKKIKKELDRIQEQYENTTQKTLVNHFIKANNKYYAASPFEIPQVYLDSEKAHYFDFVDFGDPILANSTFLTETVRDYVFYLSISEGFEVQQKLYKKSVDEVMQRIGENIDVKNEVLITLLNIFSEQENIVLTDYLLETYYSKLPEEIKNTAFLSQVKDKLRLAVGRYAPDFTWKDNGLTKNLYGLKDTKTYILAFWSTSCSHCLKEIPKLYEYVQNKKNVQVIAYALELDELGYEHHTKNFPNWINVLGLEKWQNPIARLYDIVGTPSYFVLDAHKKIIAKPELFNDVKTFFSKKDEENNNN